MRPGPDPSPDDPPFYTKWRNAWCKLDPEDDDIDPMYEGINYYDLDATRIYEGDKFWWEAKRYLIEVTDVKTKCRADRRGLTTEEMDTHVFYEPDFEPHTPVWGITQRDWRDNISHIPTEEFSAMIADDTLVPHRGNGLPPLP